MITYNQWREDDQKTVITNKSPQNYNAARSLSKIGDIVKIRLHPNDPYPSPGWKVTKIADQAIVVQKAPSITSSTQVGQALSGSMGGTLIIPNNLFVQMIINDKPNLQKNMPTGINRLINHIANKYY